MPMATTVKMIDQDDVESLRVILEKKLARPITAEHAAHVGQRLISLVELLAQIDARSRSQESRDRRC